MLVVIAVFTGIVEETGRVISFVRGSESWRLVIAASAVLEDAALGDSIAVNGCCLTIVQFDAESVSFDVLAETKRVTDFEHLSSGTFVNLERALRFGGKMGGHFVSGHIDGVGTIEVIESRGADTYLRVRGPAATGKHLIHRGSIAIDGISLTLAEVEDNTFAVWLIPHTLEITNLSNKTAGDLVNLEFDLLGKYVEKLMVSGAVPPKSL